MHVPLSCHTHYSLLRGFSKPQELISACSNFGIGSIAITDIDSMSGAVNFSTAADKAGIKPLLGTKLLIAGEGYVTAIAKNLAGWGELCSLVSQGCISTVTFDELAEKKNIIVISGGTDSTLAKCIISTDYIYTAKSHNSLSSYLNDDYQKLVDLSLNKYASTFGDRFLVGLQRCSENYVFADKLIADCLSDRASYANVPALALTNSFYTNKEDKIDHSTLLCSYKKTTLSKLKALLEKEENASLCRFADNDMSSLLSPDEFATFHSESELKNTQLVSDMCEKFTLLDKPRLPIFPCPNNLSQDDYLREVCRDGWRNLSNKMDKSRTQEYINQVNMELDVFKEVELSGYFLIVQDFVKWAQSQGMLTSPGRGSSGGSLVSYLSGITRVDPIQYGLFFERFYNKGRNSGGKVSLPDIDVDFPIAGREKVIEYIRNKYRKENVSSVVTFSRLQGRGAIKEILRVHQMCDNTLINEISKRLPQEAEIADKMEEEKETSIIRWVLNNEPDRISSWCTMDKNGVLNGSLSSSFAQAIRVEGTFRNSGKHASAVIIATKPIAEICPMMLDKSGGMIAGIEYTELESMGIAKLDILGTTILDKLMGVNSLLRTGTLTACQVEKEEVDEDDAI